MALNPIYTTQNGAVIEGVKGRKSLYNFQAFAKWEFASADFETAPLHPKDFLCAATEVVAGRGM